MIVTVFRSRLQPGVDDAYLPMADRMDELARTMPGYIAHKGFTAADGERLTIIEFESEEALRAWRHHPDHKAAQLKGREAFYSVYHIQVCELLREARFEAAASPGASGDAQA
ncbi:MAG: antibiotic biosynthesis monooxygenase [Xanthobacteraceae bacterium]